jgi:hypothetical protein
VVCPATAQLPNDDSSDDNRDDSGPGSYARYSPKTHLSCLITALPAPGSVGSSEDDLAAVICNGRVLQRDSCLSLRSFAKAG